MWPARTTAVFTLTIAWGAESWSSCRLQPENDAARAGITSAVRAASRCVIECLFILSARAVRFGIPRNSASFSAQPVEIGERGSKFEQGGVVIQFGLHPEAVCGEDFHVHALSPRETRPC